MLPGTYKATLNVNGRDAQTIDVVVKGDPEITITDADRRIWFDTAKDLHELQAKANDVAEMVQNAYAQVQILQQQTQGRAISRRMRSSSSITSSRNSTRFGAASASVSRAVAAASAATPKTCAAASAR